MTAVISPELRLICVYLGAQGFHVILGKEKRAALDILTEPKGIAFEVWGDRQNLHVYVGTKGKTSDLTVGAIRDALKIARCLQEIVELVANVKNGKFAILTYSILEGDEISAPTDIVQLLRDGLGIHIFAY